VDVEMVDKTGQPRSDDDLKEAIAAVEVTMVKHIGKCPPQLLVSLPTIRAALRELLVRRNEANEQLPNKNLALEALQVVLKAANIALDKAKEENKRQADRIKQLEERS